MYRTIEIGGQKYYVSFGMNALATFTRDAKLSLKDFEKLADNLDLHNTLNLVRAGLKDGHRKAKKAGDVKADFLMTREDVGDLLDSDPDGLNKIMEVFNDSMPKEKEANGKLPQRPKGRKKSPLTS